MRKTVLVWLLAVMVSQGAVYAEVIAKDQIPEAVLNGIYNKHPKAFDITARTQKHFNQELIEVFFKDGEEKLVKLYRIKGPFYVNGSFVEASGLVPDQTFDNLKKTFGDYEVKQTVQVVNPNGPGEEFDMIILSGGAEWSVSIDVDGKVVSKEP